MVLQILSYTGLAVLVVGFLARKKAWGRPAMIAGLVLTVVAGIPSFVEGWRSFKHPEAAVSTPPGR